MWSTAAAPVMVPSSPIAASARRCRSSTFITEEHKYSTEGISGVPRAGPSVAGMKILLIGATGTLGTAVHKALADRGHELVTVGRGGGDLRHDITDPAQVTEVYDRAGRVDAVVSAAGHVPYKPVTEMTPEDYLAAFRGKVLSQIDLVRQGVPRIAERGSFTLITGVLSREPIPTGSAASMANGAVEARQRGQPHGLHREP
jgi:NAD(P)-dependent dehydrogenase (short-subunit alcohol dehydrogenase family)